MLFCTFKKKILYFILKTIFFLKKSAHGAKNKLHMKGRVLLYLIILKISCKFFKWKKTIYAICLLITHV